MTESPHRPRWRWPRASPRRPTPTGSSWPGPSSTSPAPRAGKLTAEQAEDALRTHLPGDLTVDPLYSRPARAAAARATPARCRSPAVAAPGPRPALGCPRPARPPRRRDDERRHRRRPRARGHLAVAAGRCRRHRGRRRRRRSSPTSRWAGAGQPSPPPRTRRRRRRAARRPRRRRGPAGGNLGHDPIGHAALRGGRRHGALVAAVRTCLPPHPSGRSPSTRPSTTTRAPASSTRSRSPSPPASPTCAPSRPPGVAPAHAVGQIDFRMAASADQFLTIAALRALRRLWARVAEASGVPEADRGARIHAVTSWRMLTRDDPWTNVLRETLARFGAAAGGADVITVLPYDTVHGLPERFSRRLARNTSLVLAQESHVGAVATRRVAPGTSSRSPTTSPTGPGPPSRSSRRPAASRTPLDDGTVADLIAETSASAREALAERTQPITGISMFPLADETALERTPARGPAAGPGRPRPAAATPRSTRRCATAARPTPPTTATGRRRPRAPSAPRATSARARPSSPTSSQRAASPPDRPGRRRARSPPPPRRPPPRTSSSPPRRRGMPRMPPPWSPGCATPASGRCSWRAGRRARRRSTTDRRGGTARHRRRGLPRRRPRHARRTEGSQPMSAIPDFTGIALGEGAPAPEAAARWAEAVAAAPGGGEPGRPPSSIDVPPLYTEADLDGLDFLDTIPGIAAVPARPVPDDVRHPAVDHPAVRRLLHRRGVQRLLPAQPRRRPEGPVGRLRPGDPPRLRQRPPARRRRRRHGRRGDRLDLRHADPVRRHPAGPDDACR